MDGGWNGTWTQTGTTVRVTSDFTLAAGGTGNVGFVASTRARTCLRACSPSTERSARQPDQAGEAARSRSAYSRSSAYFTTTTSTCRTDSRRRASQNTSGTLSGIASASRTSSVS